MMQRFLRISEHLESTHFLSFFISINNVSNVSLISFYARYFVLDKCDKISTICISAFLNLYCYFAGLRWKNRVERKTEESGRFLVITLSRYNTFTAYPMSLSSLLVHSALFTIPFRFRWWYSVCVIIASPKIVTSYRRECAPRERIPCFYASTFLMRESYEFARIRTKPNRFLFEETINTREEGKLRRL